MALRIADNFNYQGKLPNFDRDTFKTLSEMKDYPETSIDEGHLSLCLEDGKRYEFLSTNIESPTTGKWRRVVDSVLDTNSENSIQNNTVTRKIQEVVDTFQALIRETQELGIRQAEELLGLIEDLESFLGSHAGDIITRLEDTEGVISAAVSRLNQVKLDKTATINGHPIGDGLDLTKSDIGLGRVDNTTDAEKPVSLAVSTELGKKVDKVPGKNLILDTLITKLSELPTSAALTKDKEDLTKALNDHGSNYQNPHKLTAAQIGLGSYADYTVSTLPVSQVQQGILDRKVDKSFRINGHQMDRDSVDLTKSDLILGNVDNTRDLDKPISIAQRDALEEKADGLLTVKSLTEQETGLRDLEKVMAKSLNDIKVVLGILEERSSTKTYTLDFGLTGDIVQDINMTGYPIELVELKAYGIRNIYISYSGKIVRKELDPENLGNLIIEPGELITWQVERTDDSAAVIGVKIKML